MAIININNKDTRMKAYTYVQKITEGGINKILYTFHVSLLAFNHWFNTERRITGNQWQKNLTTYMKQMSPNQIILLIYIYLILNIFNDSTIKTVLSQNGVTRNCVNCAFHDLCYVA